MKPRISMITLGVRNLEQSIRFYEQGLGLPRRGSPPEVAFFALNGSWLGLYGRESLARDAGVPADGTGFVGVTIAHNVDSEAEVDEVLGQAVSAGATLVKRAQKACWGGYSGYFADPDGHLWEVAYNPLFWVGPKDEGQNDESQVRGKDDSEFYRMSSKEYFRRLLRESEERKERQDNEDGDERID
jgi:hypothetical protein